MREGGGVGGGRQMERERCNKSGMNTSVGTFEATEPQQLFMSLYSYDHVRVFKIQVTRNICREPHPHQCCCC